MAPLDNDEISRLLLETNEAARSSRQTLDEVVVPALKGTEKEPGLLSRMSKAEDQLAQQRTVIKVAAVAFTASVSILTLVFLGFPVIHFIFGVTLFGLPAGIVK